MSVNRYIEELVRQDTAEAGQTFVDAAADFMKQYESLFAEEFGAEREGARREGARRESARRESAREGRR
jgi:hypothetical protein